MKLLMITPRVGSADPVLAFIPNWIAHLARQVDTLWVVTPRFEPVDLPANVHVIQVGRDYAGGENVLHALHNFHRALWRLTRQEKVDGIFAHMFPKFAIMAAPYARLNGIPLVLWFTHRHVSGQLRLAGVLVDKILTAAPETCQLASPKVLAVGHGIDTDLFVRSPDAGRAPGQVLVSLGRISPVKNLEVILQAANILVHQDSYSGLKLILAGAPALPDQAAYLERLRGLVQQLDLQENVTFSGQIPHEQVPGFYDQSVLFVSAGNSGIDKAILEAMSSELPVVVSFPGFRPILGKYADILMFPPQDAPALAERLARVLSLPEGQRQALGRSMRQIVQSSQDISSLMAKVVAVFEETCQRRGQSNRRNSA